MSDPIATPDDLATYLGGDVDTARATLVIRLAQDLCEGIVSPLPATAKAVVVDVAVRAYSNPQQLHDAALGTARLGFGATGSGTAIGGLYLSKSNRADLKRAAGRGAAFTADTLPAGYDAAALAMPSWDYDYLNGYVPPAGP